MKITALAGGVGGAKLAAGLQDQMEAGNLTVVVNTGDDFNHLGLRICPDVDTICYTGWNVQPGNRMGAHG
jgi:LPPG:FO 2-phospho-L-lactate transferase